MTETIAAVFWTLQRTGNNSLRQLSFEKIWDDPAAELYANPHLWLEAIHPEDIAKVRIGFESLTQGGTFDVDYRISARTAPWSGSATAGIQSVMTVAEWSVYLVLQPTSPGEASRGDPTRP